jgi:hypothetical protein
LIYSVVASLFLAFFNSLFLRLLTILILCLRRLRSFAARLGIIT